MIRCNECGFINGFPSSSLIPPPLCLSLLGSARHFICSSAKGFYIGGGGGFGFSQFPKFFLETFFFVRFRASLFAHSFFFFFFWFSFVCMQWGLEWGVCAFPFCNPSRNR